MPCRQEAGATAGAEAAPAVAPAALEMAELTGGVGHHPRQSERSFFAESARQS